MKRVLCIVGSAVLLSATMAFLDVGAQPQMAAPTVEIAEPGSAPLLRKTGPYLLADEPVHDWGTVEQGTEMRHTFHLRNRGTKTVTIHKARTSCGCGAFDFTREIPPGAEGHLSILIPRDRIQPGRLRASITLITNATGDDILVLQGDVVAQR
jgi:hypothetical protein